MKLAKKLLPALCLILNSTISSATEYDIKYSHGLKDYYAINSTSNFKVAEKPLVNTIKSSNLNYLVEIEQTDPTKVAYDKSIARITIKYKGHKKWIIKATRFKTLKVSWATSKLLTIKMVIGKIAFTEQVFDVTQGRFIDAISLIRTKINKL